MQLVTAALCLFLADRWRPSHDRFAISLTLQHQPNRRLLASPYFPTKPSCLTHHSASNSAQQAHSVEPNDGNGDALPPLSSSSSTQQQLPLNTWVLRAKELLEYSKVHGDCLVPKRYAENPSLGFWVNRQRQHYRRYRNGETPCSMTLERIQILNDMGFCWDASSCHQVGGHSTHHNSATTTTGSISPPPQRQASSSRSFVGSNVRKHVQQQVLDESLWWSKYKELVVYLREQNATVTFVHDLPLKSRLDDWVRATRLHYDYYYQKNNNHNNHCHQNNNGSSHKKDGLTTQQIHAMNRVDPLWHLPPRDARWERRFQELIRYLKEHGDCCVPISYSANKPLANWVSTQRKQYNRKHKHQNHGGGRSLPSRKHKSDLTDERERRLESVGFVWNRWEHEFAQQLQRQQQQQPCGTDSGRL